MTAYNMAIQADVRKRMGPVSSKTAMSGERSRLPNSAAADCSVLGSPQQPARLARNTHPRQARTLLWA
jgi:hypothetical protein